MKFVFESRRCAVCALAVLTAVGAAACSVKKEVVPLAQAAITDSVRAVEAAHALLGPAAKAALDRGNAHFRKHEYAAALVEYRAASALAPQHAAPLYGISMVARATNDTALDDSALKEIRLRSGPLVGPAHGTPMPSHPK